MKPSFIRDIIRDFKDRYGELLGDIERNISYLTEWVLSPGWMRTYYGTTRDYSNRLQKKFNLTNEEFARGLREGFADVMKEKGTALRFKLTVTGRILLRALFAAVVSFICDLPPFNMQWLAVTVAAMLVDVLFFQRQVFLMIQELEILYEGRDRQEEEFGWLNAKYKKLQSCGGKFLQCIGLILKFVFVYMARLFRKSFRRVIVQIVRVVGVRASDGAVNATTSFVVGYGVQSLIAGIASFVLFVWIAWHERKKLQRFIGHDVTPASDRCV